MSFQRDQVLVPLLESGLQGRQRHLPILSLESGFARHSRRALRITTRRTDQELGILLMVETKLLGKLGRPLMRTATRKHLQQVHLLAVAADVLAGEPFTD